MSPQSWFFFFGAAFVALAQTSLGQRASNWRVYKVADGLPESACISVTVSPNGKVLVKHLSQPAISELDGYSINTIPSPASGQGRVYESAGGQLWTISSDGLQEFEHGDWVVHPLEKIPAGDLQLPDPTPLYPVKQGLVILLLPDALLEFNTDDPAHPQTVALRSASQTGLGKFSGMTVARDGGLWIAGARGLAKVPGPVRNLKPETEWREFTPPETLHIHNLREPQADEDGGVTAVAESSDGGRRVLVRFDGQRWTTKTVGNAKIRRAWRGPDKTFWAMTIDSLFQWPEGRPEMIENEEISARQYFDLAVESGGAFWLATSDGLFRYAPPVWRSPGPVQAINSPVDCLEEDSGGRLWFISGGKLQSLQNDSHEEYSLPSAAAQNAQTTRALFLLKDGTLLVEAGGKLFRFQPGSGLFSALPMPNDAQQVKPLGLLKDGSLCIESWNPSAADGKYHLDIFDGNRFQPFPYPSPLPVFGGNLSTLFTAQNGDLWLGGDHGAAWFHDNKWRAFTSTDKTTPEAALCFAELTDGRIWCATQDKIWEFDGRNWLLVRSGFDRINALLRARDGSIWVASNSGLHRFFQGAWIETGVEEGLPSATVREVYEDRRGHIWAGTAHGLSLYHSEADPDPPQTSIQKLTDKEGDIPEGGAITLTFNGRDKWKYTPQQRLLYSYQLDGHDWSPFRELNAVSFVDLPAGKHYFLVRALDRNGNLETKPAKLEFAVALPWYKETRLILISFAGTAVALFFAGVAFNRHRQLLRSYAVVEKKVTERTRELEIANRELLHSQKMNALGTLAAGIAHDFNNILSIIKGSAQIIEDNPGDSQKIRTRVDRIKTVVEQGSGIVKAMLGFSSADQQPGRCDLNAVMDDTVKLLGDRFLREVHVSFERAPNLPEVPASKDFVQQILLNFIFNAAESMTTRKHVTLATRRMDKLPADLVLMPTEAATYVAISVRDVGCGIIPENMSRIFEPFFTTKALSTRRGTGLGLSMVYELAKKMDAGLAVESIVEQGSIFSLILPVRELTADAKP